MVSERGYLAMPSLAQDLRRCLPHSTAPVLPAHHHQPTAHILIVGREGEREGGRVERGGGGGGGGGIRYIVAIMCDSV